MSQVSATLKQIYLQSPITITLFLSSILFSSFILFTEDSSVFEDTQKMMEKLYIFLLISSFLGMFLGKNIRTLTTTFLWNVNKQYRNIIYLSAFAIIIIVFIIETPLIINLGLYGILIVSISLTIIFNFLLFNGSKISIPYYYLSYSVIYQKGFGLSGMQFLVSLLGINIVILLIQFMLYLDDKNREINNKTIKESWSNIISGKVLNNRINKIIKGIDLVIAKPSNYLGFNAIFSAILLMISIGVFSFFIMEIKSVSYIKMIMFALNLIILMKIRESIPQSQIISHVFSGANQSGIKSRIVKSTDKIILINNLIFIVITLLLIKLFNINVDYPYLVASMIIMLIIVLNSYLFVFASEMGWSIELFLITIFSYLLVMTITTFFIKNNIEIITTWPATIIILIVAMLSRKLSQKAFENVSFERLVKIK